VTAGIGSTWSYEGRKGDHAVRDPRPQSGYSRVIFNGGNSAQEDESKTCSGKNVWMERENNAQTEEAKQDEHEVVKILLELGNRIRRILHQNVRMQKSRELHRPSCPASPTYLMQRVERFHYFIASTPALLGKAGPANKQAHVVAQRKMASGSSLGRHGQVSLSDMSINSFTPFCGVHITILIRFLSRSKNPRSR
jgi:hypothetical protein